MDKAKRIKELNARRISKIQNRMAVWTGGIAAACIEIANANATTIVFNNEPGTGSQQDFVLGMDFVVNKAVTVVELGAFDSHGDGFEGTIEVGIFDVLSSAVPLVSITFTSVSPGTLVGGSRFKAIAPFVLSPGTYSIVAAGFIDGGSDGSGNTGNTDPSTGLPEAVTSFDDISGALKLVEDGGRRYDFGDILVFPTAQLDGPQIDPVFQAGTFSVAQVPVVPVPERGMTALLIGMSMTALGWARTRLS